jgi:DNA-binding transcriptional ArsR family regulator
MKFKYNPGFSSDENLISAFVVRQIELQQVLQTIEENTGRTYQHLLLVGARGTGKTMLVRRVAAEVRRSETLKQTWYPLVFGEESYRILSAGEFWLEALCHLAAQNPGSKWQGIYEDLREEKDEQRLQQRSIANLMDFADEQGKQILLIVENLNTLFDEQMSNNDGWNLRHTLQTEPRLMLLGTATGRFDEIDNVDKAWFEFFALYIMEPLKLSECRQLWISITDEDLSENQMRPMQILTGGNPRLLQVLAEFAKGMSFRDLMANLTQLIDSHTDYFKSLLDNLPATERKVFVELLEIWKPASTNQIASAARLEISKTSALLNRLLNRGAIELVEQPGKKKYYQVSERLFNIYYLMRKRGTTDDRVKVAVDFMSIFYSDLTEQAKWIAEEALLLSIDGKKEHLLALQSILKNTTSLYQKKEILKIIPEEISDAIAKLLGMKTVYFSDLIKEVSVSRENFSSIFKVQEEEFNKELFFDFLMSLLFEHLNSQNNSISSIAKNFKNEVKGIEDQIIELIVVLSSNTSAMSLVEKVFFAIDIDKINTAFSDSKLEPLIVGLRIFFGEKHPLVAQEVFEVGQDVADRIRAKQEELAKSRET